jgi:hypothetical protein
LAGYVARIGRIKNAYNILVGKLQDKGPVGRPKRRREDNIIVVLKRNRV